MAETLREKWERMQQPAVVEVIVPDGCEAVGSIVFHPLDLAQEIPPPEVLIDDTLYCEGVHLASGHPGHGKTTMAMHWAHMAMSDGRHVVWLDYESGQRQLLRRMQDHGIPATLAAKYFHYAPFPRHAEDHLAAVAERWPSALVILDSMSKALAAAGISENENAEVTGWTVKVVQACKNHALPIVIIDHITKSGTDSDYSRGAGAKLADVDVHWRVLRLEEFNRTSAGMVHLKLKKDREGYLAFEQYFNVGDGAGNLTITEASGPPSEDAPDNPHGDEPTI